ncbi:MAG: hypothetical protein ACI8PZ_001096 [Myxococcota bacterium]|jgi:hypothetical protein
MSPSPINDHPVARFRRCGSLGSGLAGRLAACTALLVGCGVELPAPSVTGVEPTFGWNQELTDIQIEGRNFHRRVTADAAEGDVRLDGTFEAAMFSQDGARYDLALVSPVDDRNLSAVVGRGLPAGLYDLEVVAPSGETAVLQDAFTVTDIQAARLDLSTTKPVNAVGEAGSFEVVLLDPNGQPVLQSFPVVITATDAADLPVGDFQPSATFDATSETVGELVGSIGSEGYAFLALTVERPTTVTLRVQPEDPFSPVLGGAISMAWQPGSNQALRIALPSDGGTFRAVAGEPFSVDLQVEDQFENPLAGQFTVTIKNACRGFAQTLDVSGRTPLVVTLSTATENGCASGEDYLFSDFGPYGESGRFVVDPGPLSGFEVSAGPSVLRAGELLGMNVLAADIARNPVEWPGDAVVVSDTAEGLVEVECQEPIDGRVFCTGTPTRAGEGIRVVVSHADGTGAIEGRSDPITVLSSLDVGELSFNISGPIIAGVPHDFIVAAADPYGNPIDPDDASLTGDRYSFSGDEGELACAFARNDGAGNLLFRCSVYEARGGTQFTVSAGDVAADSAQVDVNNGPLAVIDAVISNPTPVAGEPVAVNLVAQDAWGNPYLVQENPSVRLRDGAGTFDLVLGLDPDGEATTDVVFTRAGPAFVEALQSSILLGVSPVVEVSAGPTAALDVTVLAPWAWVDDSVDVRIESVDAWGNRTDYDGVDDGTLSTPSGFAADVPFTMVNGVGTSDMVWSSAAIDETVLASLDGLEGASDLFQVVQECDGVGLVLEASFSGFDDAITCTRGDGTARIAVSYVGSSPGLVLYGAASAGDVATSEIAEVELELPGPGIYPIDLVAADRRGCGVASTATAWVGDPTGEPVGPVRLVPEAASMPVLSEPAELVDVQVGPVVDCSRDAASGRTVFVRTSRGELAGVAESGAGLALTLDARGEGAFTLSTANADSGGEAALVVWASTGTVSGSSSVAVLGDERPPIVWEQSPRGDTVGPVSEIEVEFSEPMLVPSLEPANFFLDGPLPAAPIAILPSDSDRVVTVVLPTPVEAGDGLWSLEISERVRDAFGNLLDGGWVGGDAAPYVGSFGDVGGALDDVSCVVVAPLSSTFRPDGDDGPGDEADGVTITLDSASTPAWWIASVQRTDGELVERRWLPPTGPEDTWTWDGRDSTGGVVPNGVYEVVVQAGDGAGNRSDGCVVSPIVVDNDVEP